MTDSAKVIELLSAMQAAIDENAQFLTDLDAAIGDNDHGINMARGFKKVGDDLPGLAGKDIGAILKKAGMDLVSTVGGSSGPLYGTAFMKAGAKAAGKNEIGMEDFLVMMEEAIGGVQMRGKAVRGEKTMLDAMIPALEAMKAAAGEGKDTKDVLDAGVKRRKKAWNTPRPSSPPRDAPATWASGPSAIRIPGATSFTVLLKAIAAGY